MMIETFNVSIDDIVAARRQRVGFDNGRALSIADTKARLAPSEAAVRTEIDLDMMAGNPVRGRASRIAKKIKFSPVVMAYRNSNNLPATEHALTQWTARILARLMK
jgi:hypothetical protein